MATNSGDLAQSLIEGGLAPQAARILANAIGNAASPTFSQGQDTTDATPVENLRLITPDVRRYQLTNLDYSPSQPFQSRLTSNPGQYAPGMNDHPYKDSQPIVSAPPLSNPRVQAGSYISVENVVEGNSAVSRVGLNLSASVGSHLRTNPALGSLEAVPLTVESDTPMYLGGQFVEAEGATKLMLQLRNVPSTGTWTPALRSIGTNFANATDPTVTYNSLTSGRWARIGNLVYLWGRLYADSITNRGNGQIVVTGLPFPASQTADGYGTGTVGYKAGAWVDASPAVLMVEANGSTVTAGLGGFEFINLRYNQPTVTSNVLHTNLPASANQAIDMIFSAWYFAKP